MVTVTLLRIFIKVPMLERKNVDELNEALDELST